MPTDCADDVDAISWGRRAKTRGVGSRGVPHRLNGDERTMYDIARNKGFVELRGSGWRKERADSPLRNTYRSWCDAVAVPAIFLHKGAEGVDEVVVDLTPLRSPQAYPLAAESCLEVAADGRVEPAAPRDLAWMELSALHEAEASTNQQEEYKTADDNLPVEEEAYRREPIYRLPMYTVSWLRPRSEAKALAKELAVRFETAGKGNRGRTKARGAPRRTPGKSRRHGGYGIEG